MTESSCTATVSRRALLAGAGAAVAATPAGPALAGASEPAGGSRARRQPNIVVIVADDLGWGEVGAYGQQLIRTPTLDRLATEGVRYTDFYAGAAVCAPARCTLLTGMHTGRCTVRNNPDPGQGDEPLAEDEVTIGHVLQSAGYRTALFGKWGFSPDVAEHHSHPNEQGFDEFFGYLTHGHAHDYYPSYLWADHERVDIPENTSTPPSVFAPDLFAERCLEFVERHRAEPFMLFWSTNVPHFPQQVPDLGPYADTDWGPGEKAHAAQITRMDGDVGRLVAKLDDLGLADDTVVLFIGDNGPHEEGRPPIDPDFFSANGPLTGYKRNLLEGGIRVPAIVWAPGYVADAGTVSHRPWAMWDALPTFAELADAPVPPYIDGASVVATLTGDEDAAPDYQYWWRLEPHSTRRAAEAEGGRVRQAAEAVRQGDWKAIRYAPGRSRDVPDTEWAVELYDLGTDLAETRDVAGEHPEVAAALVALMHNAWEPPPLDRFTWSPDGAAVHAPRTVDAGTDVTVTARFTNHHPRLPAVRVHAELDLPDGWTATAAGRTSFAVVRPGESVEAPFTVRAGEDDTTATITASIRFRRGSSTDTATVQRPVTVLVPPPVGSTYLSDLPWLSAQNQWGPVERDMSNGRDGAGDGPPISLAGQEYEKGLGVHAPSDVVFHLAGVCDRFTSDVGIDDFSANQSDNGSVVFQVWADDTAVYDSGVLTAASGPRSLDVSVAGAQRLRLVVGNAGNGNTHDHASWAGAMIHRER